MNHHFYLDPFENRMSNEEAQEIFDTFVKVDQTGKIVSGSQLVKYEKLITRFFMNLLAQVNSISIYFDTTKNIEVYESCLVPYEFRFLKDQCQMYPQGEIDISTYDTCLFWIRCACREIIHSKFIFDEMTIQSHDEFVFEFTTTEQDKKVVMELAKSNHLYGRNKTMT